MSLDLMLDSGAFSAWNKGAEIDVDAYLEFILKHIDCMKYVVNLDVIPGTPKSANISEAERERSASQGYENYYHLIEGGVPKEKLIHVFHQGEDFKWLEKMASEIPYIGLSPANDRMTPEKVRWLDDCMEYVTDAEGMPTVKFHGFAVTSIRILVRYPWYSADSTTWMNGAKYGFIFVPHRKKGEWIYDISPLLVTISKESGGKGTGNFYTLSHTQKEIVLNYLEEKGFTLEDLQAEYKVRDRINIQYFLDLEQALPKWPWAFKTKVNKGFGL